MRAGSSRAFPPSTQRHMTNPSPGSPGAVRAGALQQAEIQELRGVAAAIDRAQAVIEFDLTGHVLKANRNFLDVVGWSAEDLLGKHHRVFCDPTYALTAEYADFWRWLAAGEFASGEFRRFTRAGDEVWLQATYNPVLDEHGRPWKVVKLATDVTAAKRAAAETAGRVAAIDRAQAVVEFDLSGHVTDANQNFLDVMGYERSEVVGRHHRVFCDPEYVASEEYAAFWPALAAGQYVAGEFRRLAKGDREVWVQATYNPILDPVGRPLKVVKLATDVTAAKVRTTELEARMAAVDRAQAVIEFDLDGVVVHANDNFLRTMGYGLREIVGQHHSVFCTPDYVRSVEYRDFWLRLSKGEVIAGQFERVGKYGRQVFIQSTYNPILDPLGRPTKVVKYAYDVTEQVARERRVAEGTAAMAGAVRNLSATAADIADTSVVATGLAQQTQDDAERGVKALQASLEAIALIQRSSSSISDIVRVMAEIANQTNLLAFNASIEAARAGEHGVGFSIVAGEVRKLAERSSEAAQQIGVLIAESAGRVDEGAEVSKHAEQAFRRIVASVLSTNEAIRSISGSTKKQQEASREVNGLIDRIAVPSGDA